MERLCGVDSLSAVQRRFSDSLEVLKCMIDFFKEMADIERHYASSITKLMSNTSFNFRVNMVVKWLGPDSYVEVGTLKAAWEKMGSELLKLAQLHMEKAEEYTGHVRQPLIECMPHIEEFRKKLRLKGQTLFYNIEDARKRHAREKQRYTNVSNQCIEIEEKISMMKQPPAAPPPVISRQENRLESLKKELDTVETMYTESHRELERINTLAKQEMVNLYREAHDVELKRVNTIKGCLQTFTKSLSNTAPAYLGAMQQLMLCVDEIDGTADINRFVEQHSELLKSQDDTPLELCKYKRSKEPPATTPPQPPPTTPSQPPPTTPLQPPPTTPPQPPLTNPPQPLPTSPPQPPTSQVPSSTTEQAHLLSSVPVTGPKSILSDNVKIKMSDIEEATSPPSGSIGAQGRPKPPVTTRPKPPLNEHHPPPLSQVYETRPKISSALADKTGDEGLRQNGQAVHLEGSPPNRRAYRKTVTGAQAGKSPQMTRRDPKRSPQQRRTDRTSSAFQPLVSGLGTGLETKVSSAAVDAGGTSSASHLDKPLDHFPKSADHRTKGTIVPPSSSTTTANKVSQNGLQKIVGRDNHGNQFTLPRPPKPPLAKKPEALVRSNSFPFMMGDSVIILENVKRLAAENDYYGLLELSPEATPEELAKARRDKSKALHPDHFRNGPAGRREFAEKQLILINQAYEDVLKTPDNRTLYDQLCRFRQHYHKIPQQSTESLQQAEEKLTALQRKMKKARFPLGLQEEVTQALNLIRTSLQKSEHAQ